MSVLPIYTYGQSVLRKKAKPVRRIDDGLVQLVEDMIDTMLPANGIGLAANQVGVLERVIIVDAAEAEQNPDLKPMVLINPEVIQAEGKWTMEEGCLSIPEIREEIERAEKIRVTFKDLAFNDQEIEAQGLLARVILHEIDHLDGILFIDHISPARQKLLRGRLNKIRKGDVEVIYPIITEAVEAK